MRKLVIFIAAMSLISCGQAAQKPVAPVKKSFEMVDISVMLTTPVQRAEYLAMHYWDKFDFTDTTWISENDTAEQAFVDFLAIVMQNPPEVARRAEETMLSKAVADSLMFGYFAELYDKYLYDANSPMLDEELYIPVAEYLIASPVYDPYMKEAMTAKLNNMMKNRPGHKATDFVYTLSDGKAASLYSIRSPYTLIFFNNPDCTMCAEVTATMAASPVIRAAVGSGELTVLALYPDEDLNLWKNSLSKFPPDWINAYDKGTVIENEKLYSLRAIPSLYLLDKDKTVILKDARFELVEKTMIND